jgi:transposase-like protein
MITTTTTKTYCCRACGSTNISPAGANRNGGKRYKCHDCGVCRVLELKPKYTEEQKELILKAYHKRGSLRGISRLFGVSMQTLINWLKKKGLK